ncbi:MAG: hypothetical protein AAGJ95_16245 [Cyanobacteria bacterium J06554_11]
MTKPVSAGGLRSGKSVSCGCERDKAAFKDITGQTFNRLTAVRRVQNDKYGKTQWLFECECGKTSIAPPHKVKSGRIQSCGCLRVERLTAAIAKHGKHKSRAYKAWEGFKQRCFNSNNPEYHNYGGRGITVCDRWLEFAAFYADMGEPPSAKHSIDRIDNEGNYEPGNCRWATPTEQARNRRVNHAIEYKGETKCMTEWAEHLGMPITTLRGRLRTGWTVEDAFEIPV